VKPLRLAVLEDEFSVWRLAADAAPPEMDSEAFFSITRTEDELSIVASSVGVPAGASGEGGWRCLRVEGPLPFEMTGVLAALSAPLAEADIPIFVISTFDTDYLFVKSANLENACSALAAEGHVIVKPKK
jgi:hypothetical protein